MTSISTAMLKNLIDRMCQVILDREVEFCEFDSHAGDGDFGMSLAKGFREVRAAWDELDDSDCGTFLRACGMIITEHCGGASGPIWGSAFRAAGKAADGKTTLGMADCAALLQAAVEGIQKRGGAKRGDKTLLDALIPAAEHLAEAATRGADLVPALKGAAQAAVDGAEETRAMTASRGRASYVGERSLSHPDAGAMALGIIFTHMTAEL